MCPTLRSKVMFLKIINFCQKTKTKPTTALATIALLFHGNIAEDQEIHDYCEEWSKKNGEINYKNLRRYVKSLGYIGEIVEISSKFNWSSSEKP